MEKMGWMHSSGDGGMNNDIVRILIVKIVGKECEWPTFRMRAHAELSVVVMWVMELCGRQSYVQNQTEFVRIDQI